MSNLVIHNVNVVLPDQILKKRAVLIEDGCIVSILQNNAPLDKDVSEVFDGNNGYLSPGFIDLHIHGLQNHLFDKGSDDVQAICQLLPSYGVTGILASVLPRPSGEDQIYIKSLAVEDYSGCEVLGFFFEGPFLGLPGAIDPASLKERTEDRICKLIAASLPYKSIFAISPELPGICDLIPLMKGENNPVFITHTAATVKQTQAAIEAGARHATHFYDVFPCPPVLDPGVRPCGAVEAILADPGVSVDFILDSEHVDPVAVKMALACKDSDQVCLITDASLGAGLAPGVYRGIGDVEIKFAYSGAPARGTDNSPYPGGLAGSGLTMDMAVRNAIRLLGVDLPMACRMASLNPATVLGIHNKIGIIKEGYAANLVLLDEELAVQATWVNGVKVY